MYQHINKLIHIVSWIDGCIIGPAGAYHSILVYSWGLGAEVRPNAHRKCKACVYVR